MKIKEFYKMDMSYNCTSIKVLIAIIFIARTKMKIITYGQKMLQDTNLLQWQIWEKNKNDPIPIVFIVSLTKFNEDLKYSSRCKIRIVKLDIQTCNSNFKWMIGKSVS